MSESESDPEFTEVEEITIEEKKAIDDFRQAERIKRLEYKKKAIEKVYYDAQVQYYRALLESNEELDNEWLSEAREVYKKSAKLRKQKITSEYYWVSVNPKLGITLEQLRVKVLKYCGRKMVRGVMYSYEWDGNKEKPHVHMLVHQLECSDRDFRKNTKNTFKDLVGNLECIKIFATPDDWIDDKIAYIKGEKWDTGKDEMIAFDKEMRKKLGLEDYYKSGDFGDT